MKLEESGLMMRKLFLDIDGEVEGVGPAWGGGGGNQMDIRPTFNNSWLISFKRFGPQEWLFRVIWLKIV